jgi:exonuclease III
MTKSNQMICVVWNIRGLNKTGRLKCLADFIRNNNLDFVGIQETKKADLQNNFLEAVNKNMSWNFVPAKGTARGILVGFKNSSHELINWQLFQFCAVSVVKNMVDNLIWRLIVVYGSPYEETKLEFIEELDMVMAKWNGPTLVGGDFNLVRSQKEKNNDIVNFNHMIAFND